MKKLAVIICLSLLMGCSKKTVTTTYNTPTSITMGESNGLIATTQQNADITHNGFQPVGTLTLDVNADRQADFKLSLENEFNMGGLNLGYSTADITSLNNDSFVLAQSAYSEFYYTIAYDPVANHVDTTSVVRDTIMKLNPKVLLHGSSVSMNDSWQHGVCNLYLYGNTPYTDTSTTYHGGSWAGANGWYIGIKFQNRLGWIRITSNGFSIHVHEFALVKSSL